MTPPKYDKENAELKNNKAIYQNSKVDELQELNLFLYAIYYIISLIAVIVLFKTSNDMNTYFKYTIAIGLLFFPMLIRFIEIVVYNNYQFTMSYLYGIPFERQ